MNSRGMRGPCRPPSSQGWATRRFPPQKPPTETARMGKSKMLTPGPGFGGGLATVTSAVPRTLPGHGGDGRRTFGDAEHEPRSVHSGHGRIARRPAELCALDRVSVRVERLRHQPQSVSDRYRHCRRCHHYRLHGLRHGHQRLTSNLVRGRRDTRRAIADSGRQPRRVDRRDERVRARPGYRDADHHAPDLIAHFGRQPDGVPQGQEQNAVGFDRYDRRYARQDREGGLGYDPGRRGGERHFTGPNPRHQTRRVYGCQQGVARRPHELGPRHQMAVRVGRLGRQTQRIAHYERVGRGRDRDRAHFLRHRHGRRARRRARRRDNRGGSVAHGRHQPGRVHRRHGSGSARPSHRGPRHRLAVLVAHLGGELHGGVQGRKPRGRRRDGNRGRPWRGGGWSGWFSRPFPAAGGPDHGGQRGRRADANPRAPHVQANGRARAARVAIRRRSCRWRMIPPPGVECAFFNSAAVLIPLCSIGSWHLQDTLCRSP